MASNSNITFILRSGTLNRKLPEVPPQRNAKTPQAPVRRQTRSVSFFFLSFVLSFFFPHLSCSIYSTPPVSPPASSSSFSARSKTYSSRTAPRMYAEKSERNVNYFSSQRTRQNVPKSPSVATVFQQKQQQDVKSAPPSMASSPRRKDMSHLDELDMLLDEEIDDYEDTMQVNN